MPEERLPSSVYWRRRVVVLGIPLVLLVVLVLWLLIRNGGDDDLATPVENPVTTPATSAAAPPPGVADCAPPTLTVGITADAASFAAGVSPTFTLTITNAGNTPCVVDAGDLQREVVVVSGNDRIWSSKDCAPAGSPARSLLLAAGMTDTTQIAWNRVRSAEGCPTGLPEPKPGTYQASVALAGTSGGPVVFQLG